MNNEEEVQRLHVGRRDKMKRKRGSKMRKENCVRGKERQDEMREILRYED